MSARLGQRTPGRPDGRIAHALWPFRRLLAAVGIAGSGHRESAHALRPKEEQYRALVRAFPDGAIVLFDHDLRYVIADGAALATVGLSPEQMEGKTLWEVLPSEVAAANEPRYRQALAGTGSTFDFPYRDRIYNVRVVPVRDHASTTVTGGAVIVIDITERKAAERDLREASERFARIFNNAPIGEAIVAPDGRFLQVNRALCEIVGYTEDELLARTFQDITHPDDLGADLELVRQMLAGERRTYQLEKRYFHALGHTVWVKLSVSLAHDDAGESLYFVSQIEDITERRSDQESLRESEARLAEAQRTARMGSWEWRTDTDKVVLSEELYRISGIQAGTVALTYASYLDLVHPDDQTLVEQVIGRARDTGEPYTVEHRVVHDDGSIHWVYCRGEVEVVDGEPVRMHGTAEDVTERKEVEERLSQAELRYRTLVEQLPLVTYVRPLDIAEANIYCSPNVAELLGYTAHEWETDRDLLARIVHPDDRDDAIAAGERVRRTGEPYRGEYRYLARDGRIVWVQDETFLVRDEGGAPLGVQGYLLDITERKLAEQERDRLQAELYHAQKIEAIGQLAGGVAHEFNNTLTAITAYSSLVLEQLEPGSPLRHDVEQVIGSAARATSLTRQLLAFGRKQVLQPQEIDLNEVVRTSIDLLRPLVHSGIRLATEAEDVLPTTAADPIQVQQVIVNLVLNARDAIVGEGLVTIGTDRVGVDQLSAEQHDVEPGDYLAVRVVDTGCGMDETTRSRMFEPFFTTKDEGKGTGLGLSTAYGIVRQCGGFLTVESALGDGTTIAAHFPVRAAPLSRKAAEPAGRPQAGLAGTALVVDDEEAVRDVCAALLERMGYTARTAPDGDAALASLRASGAVDVLLTDVVMPGLGGVELGRRVSALLPTTLIIYMSGFPGDLTGAGDELLFLQKPFSPADLEALLAPREPAPVATP